VLLVELLAYWQVKMVKGVLDATGTTANVCAWRFVNSNHKVLIWQRMVWHILLDAIDEYSCLRCYFGPPGKHPRDEHGGANPKDRAEQTGLVPPVHIIGPYAYRQDGSRSQPSRLLSDVETQAASPENILCFSLKAPFR
jgi:hypothetical protein